VEIKSSTKADGHSGWPRDCLSGSAGVSSTAIANYVDRDTATWLHKGWVGRARCAKTGPRLGVPEHGIHDLSVGSNGGWGGTLLNGVCRCHRLSGSDMSDHRESIII